jgi:internalin A
MRNIWGALAGIVSLMLSLLLVGNAVADSAPQPLPADICAAWGGASAQFGWMTPDGYWDTNATGRPGDIPAFYFNQYDLTPNVISQLPLPNQSFGLDLGGTSLTDSNLVGLSKFTHLQELNLQYDDVTDAGLKQLAGLIRLQVLNLRNTQVTDAGLKELADLSKLQTLNLSGTQVTDAGVAELQKMLPNLKVDR